MSSERTLAVQRHSCSNRTKSLALLAWTLCLNVFGSGAYSKPAQISLECKHYSLTSDAPSGKEGAAFMALMAEKARLAALLPEGWSRDMTTFLSLSRGGAVIPAQFLHRVQHPRRSDPRVWSHVTQPAGYAGERHRFSHARLVAADKSKLLRTPEKSHKLSQP